MVQPHTLTVLWLVGIANAVNLIDGMDGLAAGVSAISALTIWSVALATSIDRPYAALAARCTGWCVARIFALELQSGPHLSR